MLLVVKLNVKTFLSSLQHVLHIFPVHVVYIWLMHADLRCACWTAGCLYSWAIPVSDPSCPTPGVSRNALACLLSVKEYWCTKENRSHRLLTWLVSERALVTQQLVCIHIMSGSILIPKCSKYFWTTYKKWTPSWCKLWNYQCKTKQEKLFRRGLEIKLTSCQWNMLFSTKLPAPNFTTSKHNHNSLDEPHCGVMAAPGPMVNRVWVMSLSRIHVWYWKYMYG